MKSRQRTRWRWYSRHSTKSYHDTFRSDVWWWNKHQKTPHWWSFMALCLHPFKYAQASRKILATRKNALVGIEWVSLWSLLWFQIGSLMTNTTISMALNFACAMWIFVISSSWASSIRTSSICSGNLRHHALQACLKHPILAESLGQLPCPWCEWMRQTGWISWTCTHENASSLPKVCCSV